MEQETLILIKLLLKEAEYKMNRIQLLLEGHGEIDVLRKELLGQLLSAGEIVEHVKENTHGNSNAN